MLHRILGIFLFVATLSACKPNTPTTEVLSLDNFASSTGSVTRNSCQGPYKDLLVDFDLQLDPSLPKALGKTIYDTVARSLTSVPPVITASVLQAPNSSIRITPDVDSICRQSLSPMDQIYAAEGSGNIEACWKVDEGGLRLYFAADKNIVAHHLVRMLARAYGEVFAEIPSRMTASQRQKHADYVASATKFVTWRAELRDTFLHEVADAAKQGRPYSLRRYASLMKNEAGKKILADYVFAESMDSFLCSPRTEATMLRDFPRTRHAVAELVFVADNNVSLAAALTAKNKRAVSFGLDSFWESIPVVGPVIKFFNGLSANDGYSQDLSDAYRDLGNGDFEAADRARQAQLRGLENAANVGVDAYGDAMGQVLPGFSAGQKFGEGDPIGGAMEFSDAIGDAVEVAVP